jgi:hypothetical protein
MSLGTHNISRSCSENQENYTLPRTGLILQHILDVYNTKKNIKLTINYIWSLLYHKESYIKHYSEETFAYILIVFYSRNVKF